MILIFKNKDFQSKVDYHEKRYRSNNASRTQKEFSDGYLSGVHMLEVHRESKNVSYNARQAHKLISNPDADYYVKQQAKGLVAALYDYKKTLPKDINVWGKKMKTRRNKN